MADISDILADVSRDPFAEYDETYASADKGRLQPGQADLQALTRAWVNERGAAELLPYELSLLWRIMYIYPNIIVLLAGPKMGLLNAQLHL